MGLRAPNGPACGRCVRPGRGRRWVLRGPRQHTVRVLVAAPEVAAPAPRRRRPRTQRDHDRAPGLVSCQGLVGVSPDGMTGGDLVATVAGHFAAGIARIVSETRSPGCNVYERRRL